MAELLVDLRDQTLDWRWVKMRASYLADKTVGAMVVPIVESWALQMAEIPVGSWGVM